MSDPLNVSIRQSIWNAAMERAAEICEANLRDDPIGKFGVAECARDIRASKLPLPTPQPGMNFPPRDETSTEYLRAAVNAWGPDEGLELTQETWATMRSAIVDLLTIEKARY